MTYWFNQGMYTEIFFKSSAPDVLKYNQIIID